MVYIVQHQTKGTFRTKKKFTMLKNLLAWPQVKAVGRVSKRIKKGTVEERSQGGNSIALKWTQSSSDLIELRQI